MRYDSFSFFGSDYNTPDGTCIRDFIHVRDLSTTHVKLLAYISENHTSVALNCGTGSGCSVNQVMNMAQKVMNKELLIVYAQRRYGDPEQFIAANDEICSVLDWTPKYSDLECTVRDCYSFLNILIIFEGNS